MSFPSSPGGGCPMLSTRSKVIAQAGSGMGQVDERWGILCPSQTTDRSPEPRMDSSPNVTALLGDWNRGDRSALSQLFPVVYGELRRVAMRQLRGERDGHTLQPTALIHEAYIRLVDQRHVNWQDRAHFFGVAAQVMRRILVDHARRHNAAKRGD